MRNPHRLIAMLVGWSSQPFFATPGVAQGTPSPGSAVMTLDATARRAVVDSIAHEFIRLYVDADTGRLIAEHIRARSAAGAYDHITDPRALADALTLDLRAINNDQHAYMVYAPGTPFDRPGAGGIVLDMGQTPSPPPAQVEQARQHHWNLGRADILPGNVGYWKITGFDGSPAALEASSGALHYLEGTDAMIFDFRGMGGGDGDQSNFIISHFVGDDTLPSLVVTNRSSGQRMVRYTLAKVPGRRRPTIPIWILTDRGTASAGEDFTFVLKHLGRATTVGDRTAGAGHNIDFVDVGQGFGVAISFTRVADPRTGAEWERVGVPADIPVPPRDALTVAHAAALDSLAHLVSDSPRRRALVVLRQSILAQARPHVVPLATLRQFTGTYEGGRVVALDSGALVFRRLADRPPRPLVALSDTTFVLDENLITFRRVSDGTMQMMLLPPDRPEQIMPRTAAVPSDLGQ